MSNSFRIDADTLRAWRDAAAERSGLRGVPAIASELDVHLRRVGDDGHAVVSRHDLFTWSQGLQGAVTRDDRAASAGSQLSLQQVVQDMQAVLGGRAPSPAPPSPRPSEAPSPPPGPPQRAGTPPEPPIVYNKGMAPGGSPGHVEFVAGSGISESVRRLLRDARGELRVIAPWTPGLDSLAPELVQVQPQVRLLVVARRPEQEDAHYHRMMNELGKRKAVTAFSPLLMTRMVIQDRDKALIGAASLHPASFPHSREAALLTTDPQAVARAVDHFDRVHSEAAGGRA